MNIVSDRMAAIDRASKQILLQSGHLLPYDYLILAPGTQVLDGSTHFVCLCVIICTFHKELFLACLAIDIHVAFLLVVSHYEVRTSRRSTTKRAYSERQSRCLSVH